MGCADVVGGRGSCVRARGRRGGDLLALARRRVPAVRRRHPPGSLGHPPCRRPEPPPFCGTSSTDRAPTALCFEMGRPPGSRSAAACLALGDNVLLAPRARNRASVRLLLLHPAPPCTALPAAAAAAIPPPSPPSPASSPPTLSCPPRAQTPSSSCSSHVRRARHPPPTPPRRCHPLGYPWRDLWREPSPGDCVGSLSPRPPRRPGGLLHLSSPRRTNSPVPPLHAPVLPQSTSRPRPRPAMHPGRVRRRLPGPSPRAQPRSHPRPPQPRYRRSRRRRSRPPRGPLLPLVRGYNGPECASRSHTHTGPLPYHTGPLPCLSHPPSACPSLLQVCWCASVAPSPSAVSTTSR